MSTLGYSAFDPIFYLHHSNVDRLWAVWQKLQILRGLPYKVGECLSVYIDDDDGDDKDDDDDDNDCDSNSKT